MIKKSSKKTIHPLMKKPVVSDDDPILSIGNLAEAKVGASVASETLNQTPAGVWPVESNILIENARYENNLLQVTLTNLYVQPMKIIAMGVKYTSSDQESIDFKDTNISLPTGESSLQISCPQGNPFKFVIRTANMTGTGCSRENINW